MFGRVLEGAWGQKRFLIYYMVSGVGAGLVQLLVAHFRFMGYGDLVTPEIMNLILNEGYQASLEGKNFTDSFLGNLNVIINGVSVGASGAVFGILLAFGMLFPNTELMLLFPPIPIKAKWFVIIYGAFELFSGVANFSGDNVAHFAHLGGMLFGFILIKYWNKNSNHFY